MEKRDNIKAGLRVVGGTVRPVFFCPVVASACFYQLKQTAAEPEKEGIEKVKYANFLLKKQAIYNQNNYFRLFVIVFMDLMELAGGYV